MIIASLPALSFSSEIDLEPGNHYFTADWCGDCQEQSIDIQILQDEGYTIQIYNTNEVPEIFKDLNIKEIPMIIVVKINEKGKQVIIRLKGKQPIKKLVKVLIKDNE